MYGYRRADPTATPGIALWCRCEPRHLVVGVDGAAKLFKRLAVTSRHQGPVNNTRVRRVNCFQTLKYRNDV